MSTQRVITGAVYVADPRSGRPIANGSVYIGLVNQDPTILANRITVNVIQQDGSTVAIPPSGQPLTTDAGGLIQYNGGPVQVTCDSSYSIAVYDQYGAGPIPYFPLVSNPMDLTAALLQPDNFYNNDPSSSSGAYVLVPPASISPVPSELVDGMEITFRPSNANGSTGSTISIILSGGPSTPYPALLPDATNDLPAGYLTTYTDVKFRLDMGESPRWINQDLGLFATNPSIQSWSAFVNCVNVPSYVTGSDGAMYKSNKATGPDLGGAINPVGDTTGAWVKAFGNTASVVNGLTLSYVSGTVIGIAPGSVANISSPVAWTKSISAVWAAGSGNGGFPSGLTGGAPVNDTWYSFWIIGKPDGTVDFGFDSSANGFSNDPTNLLASATGYTSFWRIAWVYYATAAIQMFFQNGNEFTWDVAPNDANNAAGSSVGAPLTLSAPPLTRARFVANAYASGGSTQLMLFTETRQTNSAVTTANYDLTCDFNFYSQSAEFQRYTDAFSQIRQRGAGGSPIFSIFTKGWEDTRGQS